MVLSIPHPRGRPSRDEVASGKIEIENLERTIQGLEANIEGLQSELEEARRMKHNYESYIAPLRRLPVEIIMEIVHFCRRNGTNMRYMSQACGYLRDVVVGMPSVWRNIALLPRTGSFFGDLQVSACICPSQILLIYRIGRNPL
jgi:hypothetical protein